MINLGSDNIVQWLGMTDSITFAYINNASVSALLKDSSNNIIASITLTPSGSNGNYSGYLREADTAGLSVANLYYLDMTAVVGSYTTFRRKTVSVGFLGAT